MTKRKKRHIDKALRKALSHTLGSQPDPAPGWTPGDSEVPDQPAQETAHGAPLGIAPLTLEHRDETPPYIAPPEDVIDPSSPKKEP
jgi:hypothetical protein